MSQQTITEKYEWVVVDDGREPTTCTMGQEVVRILQPMATGLSSLGRNLQAGLSVAKGDKLVVVEDDDYYGPTYLKKVSGALGTSILVGETPSRYFHVGQRKFKEWFNTAHASLCQTAFRREAIPAVLSLCNQNRYIDVDLWQNFGKELGMLYHGSEVVGIKGMPGRKGISNAHDALGVGWESDIDLARLRQWIGPDAERYRAYGRV